MPPHLILADDFTGACETAAIMADSAFACRLHRHACRALGEKQDMSGADTSGNAGTQVDVVNTQSRHIPVARAAQVIRDCIAKFLMTEADLPGAGFLYKKTDSTLRGNIGGEMEACLEMLPGRPLLFLPAFPQMGRFVENGRLSIYGTPLHETEMAHDPLAPVATDCIRDILKGQMRQGRDIVGVSAGAFPEVLKPGCVYILDGNRVDDLHFAYACITSCVQDSGIAPIFAGPSISAAPLARACGLIESIKPSDLRLPLPALLVNGSANPVSLDHFNRALETGYRPVYIDTGTVLDWLAGSEPEPLNRTVGAVLERLQECPRVAVQIARGDSLDNYSEDARKRGVPLLQAAEGLTRFLSCLSRRTMLETVLGTLILFGGENSYETVDQLALTSITPLGSCGPGTFKGKARFGDRDFCLITKSGALGDSDFMDRLSYISTTGQLE